jgi:hypothetical protein
LVAATIVADDPPGGKIAARCAQGEIGSPSGRAVCGVGMMVGASSVLGSGLMGAGPGVALRKWPRGRSVYTPIAGRMASRAMRSRSLLRISGRPPGNSRVVIRPVRTILRTRAGVMPRIRAAWRSPTHCGAGFSVCAADAFGRSFVVTAMRSPFCCQAWTYIKGKSRRIPTERRRRSERKSVGFLARSGSTADAA